MILHFAPCERGLRGQGCLMYGQFCQYCVTFRADRKEHAHTPRCTHIYRAPPPRPRAAIPARLPFAFSPQLTTCRILPAACLYAFDSISTIPVLQRARSKQSAHAFADATGDARCRGHTCLQGRAGWDRISPPPALLCLLHCYHAVVPSPCLSFTFCPL